MLLSTVVMGVLAAVFLAVGYARGQGQHVVGLKMGIGVFVQVLPLLLFAFVCAGMIQVLVPREQIYAWIGAGSGMRGILLGTVVGGVTPGGPYVSLPVMAGLAQAGASAGTLVAFLTSWSLWAVARLPLEVGILGWRFVAVRLACTFFFPPIAGLLAQRFFPSML